MDFIFGAIFGVSIFSLVMGINELLKERKEAKLRQKKMEDDKMTNYEKCVEAIRQQLLKDASVGRDKDGVLTTIVLGKGSPNTDEMLGSGRTK